MSYTEPRVYVLVDPIAFRVTYAESMQRGAGDWLFMAIHAADAESEPLGNSAVGAHRAVFEESLYRASVVQSHQLPRWHLIWRLTRGSGDTEKETTAG